jgi:hypothetical protein
MQGMRAIKDAFIVMRDILMKGWKRAGKRLLTFYRGHLEDVRQSHRLDMIMTRADLPTNIDSIHMSDEPDDLPRRPLWCLVMQRGLLFMMVIYYYLNYMIILLLNMYIVRYT